MMPDQFFREYGFAIAERPVNGIVKWRDTQSLTREVMAEDEAWHSARTREKAGQESRSKREEREEKAREAKKRSGSRIR